MTDIISPTTTLTNTHAVVMVTLSSGNVAMVEYSVSVGDVVIWVLLAALVSLQVFQLWSASRIRF